MPKANAIPASIVFDASALATIPAQPADRPAPLLVDSSSLAVMLGVSEGHVYAMLRRGAIGPTAISLGRSRRYRVDEVRQWIAAGCPSRARWQFLRGARK